jgi:hypothetical protein
VRGPGRGRGGGGVFNFNGFVTATGRPGVHLGPSVIMMVTVTPGPALSSPSPSRLGSRGQLLVTPTTVAAACSYIPSRIGSWRLSPGPGTAVGPPSGAALGPGLGGTQAIGQGRFSGSIRSLESRLSESSENLTNPASDATVGLKRPGRPGTVIPGRADIRVRVTEELEPTVRVVGERNV